MCKNYVGNIVIVNNQKGITLHLSKLMFVFVFWACHILMLLCNYFCTLEIITKLHSNID